MTFRPQFRGEKYAQPLQSAAVVFEPCPNAASSRDLKLAQRRLFCPQPIITSSVFSTLLTILNSICTKDKF